MADAAAAVNIAEMNSLPAQYYQPSSNQFHAISVSTVDSGPSVNEDPNQLPLYASKTISGATYTSTSTINTTTTSFTSNSHNKNITVKLYLSARDVPEPDSRSQANYVILYHARDILDDSPSHSGEGDENQPRDVLLVNDDDINQQQHLQTQPDIEPDLSETEQPTRSGEISTRNSARRKKSRARTRQFSILKKPKPSTHQHSSSARHDDVTQQSGSAKRSHGTRSATISPRVQSTNSSHNHVQNNGLGMRVTQRSTSVPVDAIGPLHSPTRMQDRSVTGIHNGLPTYHKTHSAGQPRNVTPPSPGSTSPSHMTSASEVKPNIFTPLIRFIPTSSSVARAPAHALRFVAPNTESKVTSKSGRRYRRSGWELIGCTEIARKHGRDIEFSKCFTISFIPRKNERLVIKACVFDTPSTIRSTDTSRQRLVGTSEFSIASVYSKDGGRVPFPLKFYAISKGDRKKVPKVPDGQFVVVAQRIISSSNVGLVNKADLQGLGILKNFRLDVECSKITRATALSVATVKRVFYTVHGILERNDETSDAWTLLFRSAPVEMIHTKKDGGSMQNNHFSGIRLRAVPGVTMQDEGPSSGGAKASRIGDNSSPTSNKENDEPSGNNDLINTKSINAVSAGDIQESGPGHAGSKTAAEEVGANLMEKFGKALRLKNNKKRFFSLPGADLCVMDDETKLKLSVWEDNGMSAGYDLVADTLFSLRDLKNRELGDSSAIKVHANVVGKAVLKYVECSADPRYFCLSLQIQNVQ